jgi:hypothetical protein
MNRIYNKTNNYCLMLNTVIVWIWNILHRLMYWGLGCQLIGFWGVTGSWSLWCNQWISPWMDSWYDGILEVGPCSQNKSLLERCILSPAPSLCFLATMQASLLHLMLSTLLLCFAVAQKQQSPLTMDWSKSFLP